MIFQLEEGGLLKDILVSFLQIFDLYKSNCVIVKTDKNFPLIAIFSHNCPGELHYQLQ